MSEYLSPTVESQERRLSDGLDYYKLTMGQVALARHADAEVTFTLKNRGAHHLAEYIETPNLQQRLEAIQQAGFSPEEIAYMNSLEASDGTPRFNSEYIAYLEALQLPDVTIATNPETGDFDIHTTGPWASVSLWETVVMSELNQLYFEGRVAKDALSLEALYNEGDRRLSEKIAILQGRPDIKIVDFGTRRRFSADWHHYVVSRLANEAPNNLIGTSNPWLAHTLGLPPIGTYAHEMPMVYAALSDAQHGAPLEGHATMMQDWHDTYNGDLSIALTDTFTSDFFFEDFGEDGARKWTGLRHDSGDPIQFGEQAIAFYERHGVDPASRTIVFSDGLDINQIVQLADYFAGKINVTFGWGTTLTNDLGIPANNFVMKATKVNGVGTVKLSDNPGKHTGSPEDIARYKADVVHYLEGERVAA